jgi:hypothetical protein
MKRKKQISIGERFRKLISRSPSPQAAERSWITAKALREKLTTAPINGNKRINPARIRALMSRLRRILLKNPESFWALPSANPKMYQSKVRVFEFD